MKFHRPFNVTASLWIAGALLATYAFTFCGCLSRPALKCQTFAFSAPPFSATNNVANGGILEIRRLQITPPFDGRSLIYRTGEFSYQRDPYAGFLGLPAEGLIGPVSEILRRDGGFSSVIQPGSDVQPDTFAEITIFQLYGDFRNHQNASAVIAMQITFIDATNGLPGKLVFERDYLRRTHISLTSPAALMEGWNQALVGILAEAASDFRNRESEGRGVGGNVTQESSQTP